MRTDEHWRGVYQSRGPGELSWSQPSQKPSLNALDRLGAVPSMSLVDVGGGASALVDALLDRGWTDLIVLDIAEPALAASRKRLGDRAGQVRWEVADIVRWQPGRTFDLWHDRAVFHFLTEEQQRAGYLRTLREGTKPGSHVIVATFALDGPEKCSGLPVRRYDAAALAAELGPDFMPLADWRETHLTPWGSEQQFQWSLFTRK